MNPFAAIAGVHVDALDLDAGPVWSVEPAGIARGAVILLPHRDGLDRFVVDVATRLVAHAMLVLAPDLFAGQPAGLTPDERKSRIVDAQVVEVCRQIVAHRRSRAPHLPGPAALGYCMGGRLAFLAASAQTGVARAVCFYGGGIEQGWHDERSPIDRVRPGVPPIQLHRGERDSNATAAAQQAAVTAADAAGGYLEACTYSGARHAFANPYAPERYHPIAARRAFARALDFLTDDTLTAAGSGGERDVS